MNPFKIYTPEDASPASRKVLKFIGETFGFVPNVFGTVAISAPALKAFVELNTQFSESTFDTTSRELIQVVTSIENQCEYCVAGHTAFAEIQHVPTEVMTAIRNEQPIDNEKLEVLRNFTRRLVRNKGMVSEQDLKDFLNAGYTPEQVLEVILGVCVKTFSNLASNVIGIPLDDEFERYAWKPFSKNKAA